MDGDTAGEAATLKIARDMAIRLMDAFVYRLADGDPYDFFRKNGADGKDILHRRSVNIYDYIVKKLGENQSFSPIEKRNALLELADIYNQMPKGIVKEEFQKKIETQKQIDLPSGHPDNAKLSTGSSSQSPLEKIEKDTSRKEEISALKKEEISALRKEEISAHFFNKVGKEFSLDFSKVLEELKDTLQYKRNESRSSQKSIQEREQTEKQLLPDQVPITDEKKHGQNDSTEQDKDQINIEGQTYIYHLECSYVIFLLYSPEFIWQATSIIPLEYISHPFARYVYRILFLVRKLKKITIHQILDLMENPKVIDYIISFLAINDQSYQVESNQQLVERIDLLKMVNIVQNYLNLYRKHAPLPADNPLPKKKSISVTLDQNEAEESMETPISENTKESLQKNLQRAHEKELIAKRWNEKIKQNDEG